MAELTRLRRSSELSRAEVAGLPGETAVRDTQHRELGHLAFTTPEWTGLLTTLKTRQP